MDKLLKRTPNEKIRTQRYPSFVLFTTGGANAIQF